MSDANKAIVRHWFEECLNQHNMDLHPELCSEILYHSPAMGELGAGTRRQFLESIFQGFPDGRWTIEDQITEEDKILTRWTFTGSQTGRFMGILPTGRQLTVSGTTIDRIADGRIVEEWEEWDTLGMMQQLGMLGSETTIADLVAP